MKKLLFLFLFLAISVVYAQDSAMNHQADALLEQKAQCFDKHKVDYLYFIQIYNGKDLEEARRVLREYLIRFPDSKAIIKWENPEYKVWTGEYLTKWEVEKAMQLLREDYPDALIVYPKIR